MSQDAHWADHLAVQGLANALNTQFNVISSTSTWTNILEAVHTVIPVADHRHEPLLLGNIADHHFFSLERSDQVARPSASI